MKTPDEKNNFSLLNSQTVSKLTDATWEFARQMLWDKIPYSKDEIILIKIYLQEMIEEAILKHKNVITLFSSITKRIINAKSLFKDVPNSQMPYPATWFNKRNPNGFVCIKTNRNTKLKIRKWEESDKSIIRISLPSNPDIYFQIYLT